MKNMVVFFSFFFITFFSVLVFSTPANADDGSCDVYSMASGKTGYSKSPSAVCSIYASSIGHQMTGISKKVDDYVCNTKNNKNQSKSFQIDKTVDCGFVPEGFPGGGGDIGGGGAGGSWGDDPDTPEGECAPCAQLKLINEKLNAIHNNDITEINNIINDMSSVINNIDNSMTQLNITEISETLTIIDNSITSISTSIENTNITNNTWFETVNNQITSIVNNQTTNNKNIQNIVNDMGDINNKLTEYSLKLGNIELAMGDIDLSLKNTNRLAVDLGLDLDLIKNDLALGNKNHTKKLNEIIDLLAECVPDETNTCPDGSEYDDTELIALLTDLQNFIKADFVPDTESTEVDVTDLTDIELDRDLIKFGVAQCPPDSEFNTVVNGFSFAGGFKHKPLCDFFTMLAPFVKAFGGFSAALVLGGGLRR